MEFAFTEQHELIRTEVRHLARKFDWGYWRELDRSGNYPHEFFNAFAASGWLGTVIPTAYGGSGLGVTEFYTREKLAVSSFQTWYRRCTGGAGRKGQFIEVVPAALCRESRQEIEMMIGDSRSREVSRQTNTELRRRLKPASLRPC